MTQSQVLKGESLFAKSDELYVAFYANLPVEVKQILKNAGKFRVLGEHAMAHVHGFVDFYGESYSGAIDTVTGFALVVSARTCFVWQHHQVMWACPFRVNKRLNYFIGS